MESMNSEQKSRFKSVTLKTAIVIGIGLAYAAAIHFFDFRIPCIFNVISGKLCPGCGVSRMCMALLHFDFALAAKYNIFVLCFLPIGIALYIYKSYQYIKTGSSPVSKAEKIFYTIVFVLCIAFTIIRNTDLIPFLKI